MFSAVLNFFRKRALETLVKDMKAALQDVESALMDDFLELLLKAMRLMIFIAPGFRENIRGVTGRYAFRTGDGKVAASAIFEHGRMTVKHHAIAEDDADITVTFRDGKALWELLMSGTPDVLSFVLESKVAYAGNVTYLFKFGYMAMNLKLKFGL